MKILRAELNCLYKTHDKMTAQHVNWQAQKEAQEEHKKTLAKCEMEHDEAISKAIVAEESSCDNYEKLVQSRAEIDKLVFVNLSLSTQNEDLRKTRQLRDFVIDELKGERTKLTGELQELKTVLLSMKNEMITRLQEISYCAGYIDAQGRIFASRTTTGPSG